MRAPIVGMGLVTVAVAGLAGREWNDPIFALLAVAATLVTLIRFFVLSVYRRARPVTDPHHLKRWERRYAIGNYAFAALLALLNVHALTFHYPVLHMITVSLVFSFGAGIVSRISIRPIICTVSLLIATVPTIVALAAHAFLSGHSPVHIEMFAIEAFLVTMITALSLQTVVHLYGSAVQHHTARHDMAQLAKYDALTGLPNRLLLRERFHETSLASERTGNGLAVHFVDLDGFKAVNDGYGHLAGDAVLDQVSRRLQAALRSEDTVARVGGDEFIVVQAEVRHESEAEMLARRVIRQLSAPYEIDGVSVRISASVGIALAPQLGSDLETLIACADAALYRSKGGGKARLSFCSHDDIISIKRAAA